MKKSSLLLIFFSLSLISAKAMEADLPPSKIPATLLKSRWDPESEWYDYDVKPHGTLQSNLSVLPPEDPLISQSTRKALANLCMHKVYYVGNREVTYKRPSLTILREDLFRAPFCLKQTVRNIVPTFSFLDSQEFFRQVACRELMIAFSTGKVYGITREAGEGSPLKLLDIEKKWAPRRITQVLLHKDPTPHLKIFSVKDIVFTIALEPLQYLYPVKALSAYNCSASVLETTTPSLSQQTNAAAASLLKPSAHKPDSPAQLPSRSRPLLLPSLSETATSAAAVPTQQAAPTSRSRKPSLFPYQEDLSLPPPQSKQRTPSPAPIKYSRTSSLHASDAQNESPSRRRSRVLYANQEIPSSQQRTFGSQKKP